MEISQERVKPSIAVCLSSGPVTQTPLKNPPTAGGQLERLRRTIHPSLVGGVISRHRPALAALLLKCQQCATVD